MSREPFITGEFYHIYNRGVEGRDIFLDQPDYSRFLLGMKAFNNAKSIFSLSRHIKHEETNQFFKQEPIVEFVCYTLMPNHYHFIVRQLKDEGISRFMQRLGTAYTKYFNKRYERAGVLFQGLFKSKHISDDSYLMHVSRYVHLNVLSLMQPNWAEEGVRNKKKAFEFLKSYQWHSLGSWLENKPSLVKLDANVVLRKFISKRGYEVFLADWLIGQSEALTTDWVPMC